MALEKYNEKRNFRKTEEPAGKESHSKGQLKFVVQKHDASHLHYDFRLEMEGVMKSWAVPKGPSLNPQDKRLAVMVEDHPLSYRNFEGTIPEGNYGAGTVMIWDEGTYSVPGSKSRREAEAKMLEDLESGELHFEMHGSKLKGEFTLLKFKRSGGEKNWLLIKKKDRYSTDEDVLEEDHSARTDRSMDEIAEEEG